MKKKSCVKQKYGMEERMKCLAENKRIKAPWNISKVREGNTLQESLWTYQGCLHQWSCHPHIPEIPSWNTPGSCRQSLHSWPLQSEQRYHQLKCTVEQNQSADGNTFLWALKCHYAHFFTTHTSWYINHHYKIYTLSIIFHFNFIW